GRDSLTRAPYAGRLADADGSALLSAGNVPEGRPAPPHARLCDGPEPGRLRTSPEWCPGEHAATPSAAACTCVLHGLNWRRSDAQARAPWAARRHVAPHAIPGRTPAPGRRRWHRR